MKKKAKALKLWCVFCSLVMLMAASSITTKAADVGVSLKSVDSITLQVIPNVTYEICDNNLFTGTIYEVTSNASGIATQLNLTKGIYFYRMKSVPVGYVKQTLVSTISVGLTGVTAVDVKIVPQGKIEIEKIDDKNNPVAGAEFSLFAGTQVTGTPLFTKITTGVDGKALISNLNPGVYALLETKAPEGYHIVDIPKVITVQAAKTEKVQVVNTAVVRASIQLYKKDAVSDTQLAQAKFGVYKDALFTQLVKEVESSATSAAVVDNLLPGTYYIKELTAPAGYLMDALPQTIILTEGQIATVTFYNHRDYPTAGNFAGPILLGGGSLAMYIVFTLLRRQKTKKE